MRNESQIPREKWSELKSGEGKTENPALRRSSVFQPRPQGFSLKNAIFLREKPWGRGCRSFFAPKPHGNAYYTRGLK